MSSGFQAIEVTDKVYWVGAIDWEIRNFHGYLTSHGTTYNAYLVMADRVTLVDTVKKDHRNELMTRIASVVDPRKIDVIISNHAEMDHSGSLPEVIDCVKPATIYASKQGVKALENHFHTGADITAVASGDRVDLGGMEVAFLETRMCHWPDSMVSYLTPGKILFSQDAFGMHLATSKMFADQNESGLMHEQFGKYFGNILLPFSSFILKTLARIEELGLTFDMIAPDHGPIWRTPEHVKYVLDLYARWSAQPRVAKALVVYGTMWQSTATMAKAIGDGIKAAGAQTVLMPLASVHRSDVATEMLDAGALVVGTPTLNKEMLPEMADALSYLRGLLPKGMIGAVFGSHGWSGEGTKKAAAILEEMNVEMVCDPLRINYVPDAEVLGQCRELGERIGRQLVERFAPAD